MPMATAPDQKPTPKKPAVRRPSKAERAEILFGKLEKAINEGKSFDQAMELLTPSQYDFLCADEFAERLDSLTTTKAQREATAQARQIGKESGSPRGQYHKKYSQEKQAIYAELLETVKRLGGEVIPKNRENYRDIDFTIGEKHYKIVFSNPRK